MKRKRVRHEIRSYAGAELYSRLLREAAARGQTLSECVRRELEELYAFRDELGDSLRIAGEDGAPSRGLLDAALRGMEARLAADYGAQAERLDRLAADVARLQAMIDRFYLGVMLHLEDVPEPLRPARLKRASERHRAWLEMVERVATSSSGPTSDGTSGAPQGAVTAPTPTAGEHPRRR